MVPAAAECLLRKWAAERPDAVFIDSREPNGSWSYRDASAEVRRLASVVAAHADVRGRCVVLEVGGEEHDGGLTPGHILAELAILQLGGWVTFVPANTASNSRLQLEADTGAMLRITPSVAPQGELVVLRIERTPAAGGCDDEKKMGDQWHQHGVCESRRVYCVFTSGTTGLPKGVVACEDNIDAYVNAKVETERIIRDSRILLASAATFDPSQGDLFTALAAGCALCVPGFRGFVQDPTAVLLQFRPTHVTSTPALWGAVDVERVANGNFLRAVSLGGEPFPVQLARRWIHCGATFPPEVRNVFGVTEATIYQVHHLITARDLVADNGAVPCIPMGTAYPGCSVELAESPHCNAGHGGVGAGKRGELVIKGKFVCRGYLQDPGQAARFTSDGTQRAFRTGDVVEASSPPCEGELRYVSRLEGDQQVKIAGRRVDLREASAPFCTAAPLADYVSAALALFATDGARGAGVIELHVCIPPIGMCAHRVKGPAEPAGDVLGNGELPEESENQGTGLHSIRSGENRVEDSGSAERNFDDEKFVVPVLKVVASRLLPRWLWPGCYVTHRAGGWPMTQHGKVDLASLRERGRKQREADMAAEPSGQRRVLTEFEAVVASAWRSEIGTPCDLHATSSWSDIGGDSLSTLRVVRRVRELLEASVAPPGSDGGAEVLASAFSYSNAAESSYGDISGVFSPKHLLERPILSAYASFIEAEMRRFSKGKIDQQPTRGVDAVEERVAQEARDGENDAEVALLKLLAREGRSRELEVLIAPPCSVSVDGGIRRGVKGIAPLHEAAKRGHMECLRVLLRGKASVTVTTELGISAGHLASAGGHLEAVRALVAAGMSPRVKDANKQTMLHHASRAGHASMLRPLVSLQVPVHEYDRWGRSALHWAVINNHGAAVQECIALGLPVNDTRTDYKKTRLVKEHPLDLALRMHPGQADLVACLISAGGVKYVQPANSKAPKKPDVPG
eukprot:gene23239-35612_t